jgi:hypothetical protein
VDFQPSGQEFYARVEQLLAEQDYANAHVSRVTWPEGGVLSARRQYLRVTRLGFRLDLCMGHFGSGSFVSWWLVRPLARWYWVAFWAAVTVALWTGILVAETLFFRVLSEASAASDVLGRVAANAGSLADLLTFGAVLLFLASVFLVPIVLFVVPLVGVLWAYEALVHLGIAEVQDISAVPIFGWLYDRLFCPVSYYRLDTGIMFEEAVHGAVLTALDEMTRAQAARCLTEQERRPVMHNLLAA